MRDAENIRAIETTGCDMIGFICWDKSCRYVQDTPNYLPQCTRVGVFVDPAIDFVLEKVVQLGLNRIQLHGNETQQFCHELGQKTGLPIIKAISIKEEWDVERYHEYEHEPSVDMFLFDTSSASIGGSGNKFDWSALYQYHGHKPFLLSGGISPEDAELLKAPIHPKQIGIDINSRFEISPALKDAHEVAKFIKTIKS